MIQVNWVQVNKNHFECTLNPHYLVAVRLRVERGNSRSKHWHGSGHLSAKAMGNGMVTFACGAYDTAEQGMKELVADLEELAKAFAEMA